MKSAAVSVQRLSKRFARSLALDDVSFEVPSGSVCGLIGPNGAGKTTLFSVAAGFIRATSGTVEVLGVDVRDISELRGRFAMLPQDAAFQSGIPVIEQLVMFAQLNGYDLETARHRSLEALRLVGLEEYAKRNARALSHGMFKRVALCQAFLGEPEVVMLDEPTSGLDPENASKMRSLITSMRDRQTVIISSHNLREIQSICDYVVILGEGKLVRADAMDEITSAGQLIRIVLSEALPEAAKHDLMLIPGVLDVTQTADEAFNVTVEAPDAAAKKELLRAIQKCLVATHDLIPRSLSEGDSLEARFLDMTGGTYDGAGGS